MRSGALNPGRSLGPRGLTAGEVGPLVDGDCGIDISRVTHPDLNRHAERLEGEDQLSQTTARRHRSGKSGDSQRPLLLEPGVADRVGTKAMNAEDGITIRAWEARDREHVQALLRLLSQDAEVRSEDAPTYVAESGKRVVGMVTLCVFRTLTGPKAYLDHLVVAPDSRRRGIGRALLRHAIEQAEEAGASRIDLTAREEKQAGRALYESFGFQERDTGSFRLHIAARSEAERAS